MIKSTSSKSINYSYFFEDKLLSERETEDMGIHSIHNMILIMRCGAEKHSV